MNISPIGFKGTFCIEQKDLNNKKFTKILSKKDDFELSFQVSGYTNPGKLYVQMPYEFDSQLMKLLAKLSVPYKKIEEDDSLDPDNIIKRIVICPSGHNKEEFLQKIDAAKLDVELKKDPAMHVGYNGKNGSGLKYDRFKAFLKTNQEIRSPIIYLRKLPCGEIETHIYDGRHRFAVLRDMGIKQIPVTIDKDSLELAKEIGLV